MTAYRVRELAEIVHGQVYGDDELFFSHLVTDTRTIAEPANSLFIALQGENRDGHQFIGVAMKLGVRAFLVQQIPSIPDLHAAVFIEVANTLRALQQLAAYHRRRFDCPIVGITGSNGKTIVKEWLHHLLQVDVRIVRSPRSYNSQLGVPLSVWALNAQAGLGIFEAGISRVGEMEKLEAIIHPDWGIFTNIGEAHREGFSSLREKIREKLKLFIHVKTLICGRDDDILYKEVSDFATRHAIRLITWGHHPESDVFLEDIHQEDHTSVIQARYQGALVSFRIPFTGKVAVENAMSCATFLLAFDKGEVLASRMPGLPALSMRMEMKTGINRCLLINDSYSLDISSLQLALDFLLQQEQYAMRMVILSDIPESGLSDEELFDGIIQLLRRYRVDKLIGIGPVMSQYESRFLEAGFEAKCWSSTEVFIESFDSSSFQDLAILIKGARAYGFERIHALLEWKRHQTQLLVNMSAIAHNLSAHRHVLSRGTRIMAMVKAFSYGSGSREIAALLQFHGVDQLAVAYVDEGVALRQAGISMPIMVMNPEEESFGLLVAHGLQPELYSFEILEHFYRYIIGEGITEYPIHIEFNTGMNRLGFETDEAGKLGEWLVKNPELRIVSVFSHLVGSESAADDAFTFLQLDRFLMATQLLKEKTGYHFIRHISNTSAITRHPSLQLDMVRIGIGLYGIDVSGERHLSLQEAAKLSTTIAQIREVRSGDTVGYNRKGKVDRNMRIATIRIGYADGYPRSLGEGRGKVLIRGALYPTIGSVCMDMTMVDITDGPWITTADEVVLFGEDLSISRVAAWAGTIPYDLMTGISQRVNRVYLQS